MGVIIWTGGWAEEGGAVFRTDRGRSDLRVERQKIDVRDGTGEVTPGADPCCMAESSVDFS
jgi:hypothetical protein